MASITSNNLGKTEYEKIIGAFKEKCIEAATEFDNEYKFEELLKNNHNEPDVKKNIQIFLDQSLKKLIPEIQSNIIGNIDCGLISVVDVDKLWSGHHGLLKYAFYINEEKWKKRLATKAIKKKLKDDTNWEQIRNGIFAGKYNKIGKTFLNETSFASILLSPTRYRQILKLNNQSIENIFSPSIIAAKASPGGATAKLKKAEATQSFKDDQIDKNVDWSLINNCNPKDFPQIIALISDNGRPLGFLQLKLSQSLVKAMSPKKVCGVEIFNSNSVKVLRGLTAVLCNHLLSKVLVRTHAIDKHFGNLYEKSQYFPTSFLRSVELDKHGDFNLYKNSLWKTELREIKDCFEYGTVSPTGMTMEIISEFWKDVHGVKKLNLEDRFKAEETLFLINKYREHFVHTLKVFLMGEKIIASLRNDNYTKNVLKNNFRKFNPVPSLQNRPKDNKQPNEFQKFEYLWMLASTIHDWAYPVEKISKVLEVYWNKFFFGANFAEEYFEGEKHGKEVLESYARSVFTDHALGHDASTCFTHMLHDYKNKQDEGTIENYKAFRDKDRHFSYTQEIIRYITLNRDHGIASALWYLGLSFECKGCDKYNFSCDCYDKTMKICTSNGRKNGQDCDNFNKHEKTCMTKCSNIIDKYFCSKIEENDIKKYFKVAHAVYNHNMATQNEIKTKIDFRECPLTFLLLLSDSLQDEGRPIGGDSANKPDRPVGHIENICFKNNKLIIDVRYKWKLPTNMIHDEHPIGDEPIVLGSEKCKKYIYEKKQICESIDGGLPCKHPCPKLISIFKHLSKLKEIMTGLEVDINVKWENAAWENATGKNQWNILSSSLDITNLKKKKEHTINITRRGYV